MKKKTSNKRNEYMTRASLEKTAKRADIAVVKNKAMPQLDSRGFYRWRKDGPKNQE